MIPPGTVAMVDYCPGFKPPEKSHPIVVFSRFATGNIGYFHVSHSFESAPGDVTIPIPRSCRTAFINGPLNVGNPGRVLVRDRYDRLLIIAEPLAYDRMRVGNRFITLSGIVQLPPEEWQPLRDLLKAHM